MRLRRVLPLGLFLAACAEAPPPAVQPPPAPPPPAPAPVAYAPPIHVTPDAPFRQAAPEGGPAVTFVAPKVTEMKLGNGVRVLLVERHDLPIISVRVVAKNGAGDLSWEPPGAASLAGAMLELGTTRRTALQISDEYEALGATHGSWIDWDSAGASVKVTTDKIDGALDLLADVALHPSFPAEELERVRKRRLTRIQQEKTNPHAVASNAVAAALFGRAHPYGHTLGGRTPEVEKIDRADLVRAHAVLFNPSRAAIVVAGDITREVLQKKLEAAFGSWRALPVPPLAHGTARVAPPASPVPSKNAPRVILVDRPDAPQSVVQLVELGVARSAPDRDAISVMNAILGGMFSSRINLNLREAHAYTYGAYSYFDERHAAGPFIAGASVKSDTTAASIGELFKEERGIQDALASPEELLGAKESLKLALPARFETLDSVTEALADLVIYDLPADEYSSRPARIDKVTAEDVQKAAKAHLHPSSVRVLVVGDRAHVEPTLEPLHLGAPEIRDAYGDPIAPAPAAAKP